MKILASVAVKNVLVIDKFRFLFARRWRTRRGSTSLLLQSSLERERETERVSSSLIGGVPPNLLRRQSIRKNVRSSRVSVIDEISQSFRRLSTPCRCLNRSMSTAGQEMRRWRISKESVDAAIIIYIQFYRHCGTLRRSQSLFREMSRRHHRRCRLCFLPKQSFPVDGILIQCLPVGVDAQRLEVADDVKRTTRTC